MKTGDSYGIVIVPACSSYFSVGKVNINVSDTWTSKNEVRGNQPKVVYASLSMPAWPW